MSDFNPESPVYLDAELTPNQSLSRSAFYVVMAIVVGINVMSAISFLAVGAFPIVGFLGLDILAVWLAFKMCFRQQKQKTRVRITADVLRVDHVNPKGERSNVQLPTAFARIELDEPVKPTSWLTLASRREAYVIGRFLTPDERLDLAKAMRSALVRARAERHPV